MLKDLVLKNRSYRRFYQKISMDLSTLNELVDLARLSPTAANRQPLKYIISATYDKNAIIFPYLKWAGYLTDWAGPIEGERPSAYIMILGDKRISRSFGCDQGIAAQSIMLGATEKGFGGCIIGSIDQAGLRDVLSIDLRYEILLILALGKPREKVVLEEIAPSGDIKYWRDIQGVHHVPKRRLNDIILY
jgi:nitroreductase